jgi:hypothetical protein
VKKAKKGLITQRELAVELGQSKRQIRRLLVKLREQRDGTFCFGASPVAAVFGHALRSATSPEHRFYTNPLHRLHLLNRTFLLCVVTQWGIAGSGARRSIS